VGFSGSRACRRRRGRDSGSCSRTSGWLEGHPGRVVDDNACHSRSQRQAEHEAGADRRDKRNEGSVPHSNLPSPRQPGSRRQPPPAKALTGRTRARLPFVLHPQRIVLRPGKSVSVSVLFLRRTPGVLGAQAAAVIEATPPPARRPNPTYRLRLLAALLVRLPNAPGARGRFAAPLAIEDQAGHLRLCARIRNTGRVFGHSRDLLLRVRSARGRLVFAAPLRSSFVLAGFQRDFCVNGPRRLPAGRYRVEAQGFFGDVRMRAVSTRFLWDPHRPRRGP
jgi:hypothetical protein